MKRIAFLIAIFAALLANTLVVTPNTYAQQAGCPPAVEETYHNPTDVTFSGPVIIHPWWNNGRPSFGQTQVKIMVPLGTTVTVFAMMGKSWTYEQNSACAANLSREFQNAPQLGVVSLEQLVREGLGTVVAAPAANQQQAPPAPQALPPSSSEEVGCPAAEETTYTTPTNFMLVGPAVAHLWWNNGKPSFGQTQVKVLLNLGEAMYVREGMGKVWRYAPTDACQATMPGEIANAPEVPRVEALQLVHEGLVLG